METTHSAYRDSVNSALRRWPELAWLNRFLQTPKPAIVQDKTAAQVFELVGSRLVTSGEEDNAASLSQALDEQNGRVRIVLVKHGYSWDVDRDILDVVCSKYRVDPRFLAKHLDYPRIRYEGSCPEDLCNAVENVNCDYYENEYTWDLGGEVFSQLSTSLGSCFSFAYEEECLSAATHEAGGKTTLLLFLRAPQNEVVQRSRVFFCYPDARVTDSSFLESQSPNTLSSLFVYTLLQTDFSATQIRDRLLANVVLPYLAVLNGCCHANYHRIIAPRALGNHDRHRAHHDSLFDEIRQLTILQRQVELFLLKFHQDGVEQPDYQLCQGRAILRQLSELIEDVKDSLSFHRAHETSTDSSYLRGLAQAQVAEAREAKRTSEKLGRLSQLAYIFLPLQVTVSALGMNLKAFGTGNIELRSFFLMLMIVATLSFAPMLPPVLSKLAGKRISDIHEISRYSQRLGFLYGWFCLCHWSTTNDKLWHCGISYDLMNLRPSRGYRLPERKGRHWDEARAGLSALLGSQHFILFPRYWQSVLNEIFEIIDKPNWGRDENHLHMA